MPLTIPEFITVKTAAGATAAFLSPEADGLKDCWVDKELNGRCTLTLSLPITSTKWQYLTDAYRIYAGGKEFVILNPDAIKRVRDGRKVWGKITAHESWVRLGKDYVDPGISNDPQQPTPPALAVIIVSGGSDLSGGQYTVGSASHALYAILQGTGWTIGTVDVTGTHDLETEKISVLENINRIQQTWGGYLIWDSLNKTVSLRDETTWTPYTGYQIRYAKNEKGITRTDDYDIVTKLYPFGENDLNIGSVNGGVIYLTNNSYTAEVLEGIWIKQDISDPQKLKGEATKYLDKVCKPRHNYRVKQVDLRTLSGYQHEDFDLGHMVDVIDDELGVNIQARVIGYKYNVFQPWQCELEVGDPIEKIESMLADSQAMVQYLNEIKTSRGQITAYKLVDESLISQKIATAAVDATKLDTKTIILREDTWTDNTPSSGYISWNQHKLYYNGQEHVINAGNTNLKYIYWDGVFNTYSASATEPDLTDGQFYIAVNNAGLHDLVWNAPAARKFIGSAFIADAAIKTANIDDLAVTDAKIASLTANKITTGQLLAYLVEIVGKNGYFRINGDEFLVYDKSGAPMGRFGHYETLADQTATFTRASTAYDNYGTSYASGVPRYEYGRCPAPVWQDLFDVDDLYEYTSGGDTPATWAISGGVLTGTGGSQATLIKNDLLLQDVEIEINSDQANAGGIIARYQDNNNYYMLVLRDDSSGTPTINLQLYKRVGGTFTSLASPDVTWVRGTSKPIKFTMHGTRLEAYFDGKKVISVIDTTFTGGGVGLRNHSTTAFRVLDFKVYYASQAVTVEEGCTNIVATWPTGWTVSGNAGMQAVDRGVQPGAAGSTVRLTNSGETEGYYSSPKFALSPSTTYTIKIKYRGTVAADKLDVYILSSTGTLVQSMGSPSSMTPAWQVYTATFTTTADITGTEQFIRFDHDGDDAGYIEIAEVELIPRSYPLSFPGYGATRAVETLTVPSSVFTKGKWAIEMIYSPNSINLTIAQELVRYDIDGNNRLMLRLGNGYLRLYVTSSGITYTVGPSAQFVAGQTYSIMAAGDGSKIRLCVNGAQIGTDTTYVEPVGTLPANIGIGHYPGGGNEQANGFISDLRISGRARTLAEHQTDYNSGLPLSVDEYTTYLMSMDGTLQPTVRKFGLWLASGEIGVGATIAGNPASSLETQTGAQGKVDTHNDLQSPHNLPSYCVMTSDGIKVFDNLSNLRVWLGQYTAGKYGLKVINGEIYSTTIRTGAEGATNYIELSANGSEPLEVVYNSKTALDIWTVAGGGAIQFYDTAVDDMRGQILPFDDAIGEGLRVQGRTNLGAAKDVSIDGALIDIAATSGVNLEPGTGYVGVLGDFHVIGGTKDCLEQTQSYGKRLLAARESPEIRYIDEGRAMLSNGEYTITIDLIFLECIELNTEVTPWLIHLTPYSDVNLYVAEVGADYFIVKERGGGISNATFVWSLSAVRKNYANIRLREVI